MRISASENVPDTLPIITRVRSRSVRIAGISRHFLRACNATAAAFISARARAYGHNARQIRFNGVCVELLIAAAGILLARARATGPTPVHLLQ